MDGMAFSNASPLATTVVPDPAGAEKLVPLCVDLDGTLVRTDVMLETVLVLIKRNPFYLFLLPLWLLGGKAHFKEQVSRRVDLDASLLPYNQALIARLHEERCGGRPLILATAADQRVAERVASHVGLFAEVLASQGQVNLSGATKADVLVRRFGPAGFDYAADGRVDLRVWRHCRQAIVVNARHAVVRQARRLAQVAAVLDDRPSRFQALTRALRVHQWAKNVLVFVPLLTSHQFTNPVLAAQAAIAFLAFSLCASSVYIVNDLFDLEADRQHPRKRKRPFAAGDLSLQTGVLLGAALLIGSVALSFLLPPLFGLVLALYYVLTMAYSWYFKGKLLLDVYFLGGLYTLRVLAGSAATGVVCSHWLLGFSMFLFLSLALVKRLSEVQHLLRNRIEVAKGRNYRASDAQALASLGTGSGFICVLILALYINSPQVTVLYRTPMALWLLCPLLMYWISRVWMIAFRERMHLDPVVFALKDPVSYLVGVCAGLVMFAATVEWPW
jgi:4-hydroxybenzoate polyprenyltransferase